MKRCLMQSTILVAAFSIALVRNGALNGDDTAVPVQKPDNAKSEQPPLQALVETVLTAKEEGLPVSNFNPFARSLSIPEHTDREEPIVATSRTAEDQTRRGMVVRRLQMPSRLDILVYKVDRDRVWMYVFLTSSDGKLQRAIKLKNDKATTILFEGAEAEKMFREQVEFWQKWRAEREKKGEQGKAGKK